MFREYEKRHILSFLLNQSLNFDASQAYSSTSTEYDDHVLVRIERRFKQELKMTVPLDAQMHSVQSGSHTMPLHVGQQKSISILIERLNGILVPADNVIGRK